MDPIEIDEPLYNSRLINNYLEYVKKFHPNVDISSILSSAGITAYELEDQGHWFTQRQVDQFNEILTKKTGDPHISRRVGRYAATSKASGAVRQYALGLMSPAATYWVVKNLASRLTRGHTFETRKLGPEKVEVTSLPNPEVVEKPHQCENRMGMLEAVSKLFTNKFAKIEHPECLHRGGEICRYLITWEKTPSSLLRKIRNYVIAFSASLCMAFYLFMPFISWLGMVSLCTTLVMGLSLYSKHLEKVNLAKNFEAQGDVAKNLLDEINIRYNDALLVKEIGQATSRYLDVQKLLKSVVEVMEKRLDFDRGGIWIASSEKTKLCYNVGYGYSPEMEELLRAAEFHLDNPRTRGVVIQSFKTHTPFLADDIKKIEKNLSKRSLEFVKRTGAQSFICVPIMYEGEPLGILLVDNLRSKRPLTQSDMSLLMGIAPQIAISIHNAMSYQRLKESKDREHNLRKLFERYVPAPVIKQYVDSVEADLYRGKESSITVLFLDIRGFTANSETMEAREAVSFLNDYFETCSLVISEEKGHINKYTGDGFLAIFGATEPTDQHTIAAFNTAWKILEMSGSFILGGKPIAIGIGLHTGKATLGNIGSQNKIEYTAIGDTVNTGARLQELTKSFHEFPIIMSRDAWKELVGHPYYNEITNLGMQKIRGKKQKLEVFGFKLLKTQSFSIAQGERGFLSFQGIKGL